MGSEDIYNSIKINEEILSAGQPTAEQLLALADEGFVTVINLATNNPEYSLPDEAGIGRSLNITFGSIGI